MAPSRRQSNGRSPLVNQLSQITSFFKENSPSSSQCPSPSPTPTIAKQTFKLNPNAKPNRSPTKSPSPSPTTPSPVQHKLKKPLRVIDQTPPPTPSMPPADKSYGNEVVEKRIRYEYDDAEEEELDLGKEKIEWVKETTGWLKRLRRGSAFKKVVIDDEDEDEDMTENVKGKSDDDIDDSSDEDWRKNGEKEANEDTEEDEEEGGMKMSKRKCGRKTESKKRKESGGAKSESGKKSKTSPDVSNKEEFKVCLVETVKKIESDKACNGFANALVGDASERFGEREAEKLHFLGPNLASFNKGWLLPSELLDCQLLSKYDFMRRDANRKCPGDVNYNPKTLYLPHDFLKSLPGGQRQWWEFKSKHMDKVLFFKMGKFYELFEMDAHVGGKKLDLQYMKGEQPHCGFPETNFSLNVEKLARKGYRVLVVEQTETPEQLELHQKEKGAKDKVVKREICAVVTKVTLTEGEMLSANPDPSYLMAVTESCQSSTKQNEERVFGVCAVDVATSRVILGQFGDDSECSALCCLLAELRPVEIIKPTKLLSLETERVMLKHTRNPLVNELVPSSEFWDGMETKLFMKSKLSTSVLMINQLLDLLMMWVQMLLILVRKMGQAACQLFFPVF
ncbi:hypothetical protein REPUB_Repub12eG0145100 [Reevesia pubescens]